MGSIWEALSYPSMARGRGFASVVSKVRFRLIADVGEPCQFKPMRTTLIAITALFGCTQNPAPVLAKVEDGKLVFDVQSAGNRRRDCMTRIAIYAEDSGFLATPETGDDRQAVENGDYWRVVPASEDQCVGRLPVRYGSGLKGNMIVKAKPLRAGTAYTVALAEGPTGHRAGRFRITPDNRVENLPRELITEPNAR
jgi:hypothetical protein